MRLEQQWEGLWPHVLACGAEAESVDVFRRRLNFEVCGKYPWLAAELFALEGMLGWGPGFRDEYEGEFFPSPSPDAERHMTRFLRLLSTLSSDNVLIDLLRKFPFTAGAATSQERMLALALRATLRTRDRAANMICGKIAVHHSAYVLGGARMFLSLWTRWRSYGLAMAGMIWLLHHPLTPLAVRAETVRRRLMALGREDVPRFLEPVVAKPEQVLAREVV